MNVKLKIFLIFYIMEKNRHTLPLQIFLSLSILKKKFTSPHVSSFLIIILITLFGLLSLHRCLLKVLIGDDKIKNQFKQNEGLQIVMLFK
jgi:hypothetical protein